MAIPRILAKLTEQEAPDDPPELRFFPCAGNTHRSPVRDLIPRS
jgi:hypothetical protein